MSGTPRDLVVLTADGNAEHGVRALLGRTAALGIRDVDVESYVHPERDPGCLRRCQEFLRPQLKRFAHALVIFDREGCGDERPRAELEADVEVRLAANGWRDRSAAIVVDPEFDAWVWSPSPNVDAVLGWSGRSPALRSWLETAGFLESGATKPARPKEAMQSAVEFVGLARSSARYAELAEKVSLAGCTDASFLKFVATLKAWFPGAQRATPPPQTDSQETGGV